MCAFAILPAILLPGPLESTPGTWEELEEAEATNLIEVAEIVPEQGVVASCRTAVA